VASESAQPSSIRCWELCSSGDALLEVFEVNAFIGILAKAPEDAYGFFAATAQHGSNVMDLACCFRATLCFSFPGEFGIAPESWEQRPGQDRDGQNGGAVGTVWGLKHESNPIKGF